MGFGTCLHIHVVGGRYVGAFGSRCNTLVVTVTGSGSAKLGFGLVTDAPGCGVSPLCTNDWYRHGFVGEWFGVPHHPRCIEQACHG